MSRFKVKIGKKFKVKSVKGVGRKSVAKLAKMVEKRRKARMRERLAYLILGALALALLVATAIGFSDESYNELIAVWGAAALPLGYVLKMARSRR